jgi:hypothetical protein
MRRETTEMEIMDAFIGTIDLHLKQLFPGQKLKVVLE